MKVPKTHHCYALLSLQSNECRYLLLANMGFEQVRLLSYDSSQDPLRLSSHLQLEG